jgi:hypothetical protein
MDEHGMEEYLNWYLKIESEQHKKYQTTTTLLNPTTDFNQIYLLTKPMQVSLTFTLCVVLGILLCYQIFKS